MVRPTTSDGKPRLTAIPCIAYILCRVGVCIQDLVKHDATAKWITSAHSYIVTASSFFTFTKALAFVVMVCIYANLCARVHCHQLTVDWRVIFESYFDLLDCLCPFIDIVWLSCAIAGAS